MDSDSENNYFSLYMKRRKKYIKNTTNFKKEKKLNNSCIFTQNLKKENKKKAKLFLESSEKKKKSTFSFIKSYNFQIPDKNLKSNGRTVKDLTSYLQNVKRENSNMSSAEIKCHRKTSRKINEGKYSNNIVNNKNKSSYLSRNNNNNYNNRIEKLKTRISNLINIIDNFEKDFIYSNKPIQIKEQLNKINFKIIPNNIDQNNNKKNINENLLTNDKVLYIHNKKPKNIVNKDFIKLNDELDIYNYCEYDNKNKILTKRINARKEQQRKVNKKYSYKDKALTSLNYKQNNKNNNNNSTATKLISSYSCLKNLINKVNYNKNKNNGATFNNQASSNSSSNKTLHKKEKKIKENNIFKRKINYNNFINQKIKQNNITLRNQETNLNKKIKNKSKYCEKNSINTNGCSSHRGNSLIYCYNSEFLKKNRKVIKISNDNIKNIINGNKNQRVKIKNRNENELAKFERNEFNNIYFISIKKDNISISKD